MITRDEFCLIFRYQLLSSGSVGNEQGQQMMRIQFLILGEVYKQEKTTNVPKILDLKSSS